MSKAHVFRMLRGFNSANEETHRIAICRFSDGTMTVRIMPLNWGDTFFYSKKCNTHSGPEGDIIIDEKPKAIRDLLKTYCHTFKDMESKDRKLSTFTTLTVVDEKYIERKNGQVVLQRTLSNQQVEEWDKIVMKSLPQESKEKARDNWFSLFNQYTNMGITVVEAETEQKKELSNDISAMLSSLNI